MVVGDDAQSIFAWRGAEFTNIYEFPDRYPESTLYKLEKNYRSVPEILGLANTAIANNKRQFPKILQAARKSKGFAPALVPCRDADEQSMFVASRILELRDEGVSLEEIAVLYRSHYHSLELQLELTRRGIPYRVQSGVRFFEQAHIKDVISYLRLIVNPLDEIAWKRVLKMVPGIGNATANRVWEQLAEAENPLALIKSEAQALARAEHSDNKAAQKSPPLLTRRLLPGAKRGIGWQNFVKLLTELTTDETRNQPAKQIEIILASGYEEHLQATYENFEARLEDLKQLGLYAARYDSTESFLSELALISTENFNQSLVGEDVVSGGEADELLTLTSVHQAKGLEWKAVFLIWAADGKFPSPRALKDAEGEEEERRLWYVALTRAADELYLTYPQMIVDYSRQTVLQKPSRFLIEVPGELYEIWSLENEADGDFQPSLTEHEPSNFIN